MKRSMYVIAHPGLWYRLCSRAPKQLYGSYSRQLLGGDEQDGKLANGPIALLFFFAVFAPFASTTGVWLYGGKRVGGSDGGLFRRDLWQGSGDGVRSGNLSVDLAGCPVVGLTVGLVGSRIFPAEERRPRKLESFFGGPPISRLIIDKNNIIDLPNL